MTYTAQHHLRPLGWATRRSLGRQGPRGDLPIVKRERHPGVAAAWLRPLYAVLHEPADLTGATRLSCSSRRLAWMKPSHIARGESGRSRSHRPGS